MFPSAPFATSYIEQKNKQQNNAPSPTIKNNAAAGDKGLVKIELLKGAGLLVKTPPKKSYWEKIGPN